MKQFLASFAEAFVITAIMGLVIGAFVLSLFVLTGGWG